MDAGNWMSTVYSKVIDRSDGRENKQAKPGERTVYTSPQS